MRPVESNTAPCTPLPHHPLRQQLGSLYTLTFMLISLPVSNTGDVDLGIYNRKCDIFHLSVAQYEQENIIVSLFFYSLNK